MYGISHLSLMQPVPSGGVSPESATGLPPSPAKSLLDSTPLQHQLDRQVCAAHSNSVEVLKGPLAVLGFTDVESTTLLGPLDDRQLRKLRELGSFDLAGLARLIGQLGDEEFTRLTDISGLPDHELDAVVNAVVRPAGDETPGLSGFDPSVWEKRIGVLLTAIIAFNIARLANAQLRGHFSVMSANAAVEQGKAIREGGNASLYSSLGMAMAAGALSGGGLFLSIKSFQAKQADITTNRSDALEAGRLQADLRKDLYDPDHLNVLKPEEQEVYRHSLNTLISDAGLRRETSEWMSQLASRQPDQLAAIGNSMSSMSSVVSNVVNASIRLEEVVQNERGVLQQSNQNVQKNLAEEQGQVDTRDAALLQKLMEILDQINHSQSSMIDALVRA
ncbi:protein IpaC [Pseudomonas vanderleydeniana]|uniref:Protein IpaC n=1 Tax=Pseudomonas vanderleydeniana TaxID=2745495 RepID=A0A9E6TR41_9PSED|nr:protein IpaC [Pseudomonas vanderleydeniana]QXI27102.1 protein IpaC [Pseudomonas vanderleydeniana]